MPKGHAVAGHRVHTTSVRVSRHTKRCTVCKEVRQLTCFHYNHRMTDGRLNQCRSCVCERAKVQRLADIDAIRKRDRARAKLRDMGRLAAQCKRRQRKDPLRKPKRNARLRVARAIAKGRLVKQRCRVCGAKRAVAHHPDYGRPLDVVWLCAVHHSAVHRSLICVL